MLFMVVERFRADTRARVYERLAERGRMMPDDVTYHGSWVEPDLSRCFQVMACNDISSLQTWASNWNDLVDFEFIPVITSAEAAAVAAGKGRT
jgi:hypothetical protein